MGTPVGSWLIGILPKDLQFESFGIDPASNLPFIFSISGCPGLVMPLTLLRMFHEPRRVKQRIPGRLFLELSAYHTLR